MMSFNRAGAPFIYRRAQIVSKIILLLLTFALYHFTIREGGNDRRDLEALIAESADLRSKTALEEEPAFQRRSHVRKDIYLKSGHTSIESEQSELLIEQKGGKFLADETLYGLNGESDTSPTFSKMGADLGHYDGQNLSFEGAFHLSHPQGELHAEEGKFFGLQENTPPSLQLAGSVQIEIFRSETVKEKIRIESEKALCTFLSQSPLSLNQFDQITFDQGVSIHTDRNREAKGGRAVYKGGKIVLYPELNSLRCYLIDEPFQLTAETIEFNLDEKFFHLTSITTTGDAEMAFPKRGTLISSGAIVYEADKKLFSAQPKSPLHFFDDQLDLEADRAFFDEENREVILEGNLRLISSNFQKKETFAIADKGRYLLSKNTLTLFGSNEKNVLFWQDGFSLAAPEIEIERNLETVQGRGDVHFNFNLEEQNYFEQIFSIYTRSTNP